MVQILPNLIIIIYLTFIFFQPNFGQIFPLGSSAPLYTTNNNNNQFQWPQQTSVGVNSPYFSVLTPLNQPQQQSLPQLSLPQPSFYPQQLIVPYSSNTLLWPFSSQQQQQPVGGGGGISSYLTNNNRGNNPQFQQQQQPSFSSLYYPQYQQQQQQFLPQQNQQNNQQDNNNSSPLNDLISQLSLALVRSFSQILSSSSSQQRDNTNNDSNNNNIRTTREGIGGFFGIPFGQPIQQQQQQSPPSFVGKTSNNYGYGVNAGVFAGTYGGSENIASPYGPYGPTNSQTNNNGGSYSGLSPWPIIPGQFRRPSLPPLQQPSSTNNNGGNNNSSNLLQQEKQQQSSSSLTGQGTIKQIPLTENVQTEAVGGGGEQQQNNNNNEEKQPQIHETFKF